jgi:hypothetical protein
VLVKLVGFFHNGHLKVPTAVIDPVLLVSIAVKALAVHVLKMGKFVDMLHRLAFGGQLLFFLHGL